MVRRFDRALGASALGWSSLAMAIAVAVSFATSEGTTYLQKLGIVSLLAPLSALFGTAMALRRAEERGELFALRSLGESPARTRLPAAIVGIGLGLVGAACAHALSSSLSDLVPSEPPPTWLPLEDGAYAPAVGVRFAGGELRATQVSLPASAPVPFGLLTLVAGIALPCWGAFARLSVVTGIGAVGSAVTTVIAVQAVLMGRLSPGWIALGLVPLAVATLVAGGRRVQR